MSGPKRTPGPWRTVDYLSPAEEIQGPEGQSLCLAQDGARLGDMLAMAAAPELLDALERMLSSYTTSADLGRVAANDPKGCAVFFARAAIAKAKGGAA